MSNALVNALAPHCTREVKGSVCGKIAFIHSDRVLFDEYKAHFIKIGWCYEHSEEEGLFLEGQ
jgi:hypothetical protein